MAKGLLHQMKAFTFFSLSIVLEFTHIVVYSSYSSLLCNISLCDCVNNCNLLIHGSVLGHLFVDFALINSTIINFLINYLLVQISEDSIKYSALFIKLKTEQNC